MSLKFTKKELAIIQELIDLHDMYYCKELSWPSITTEGELNEIF